MDFEKILLKAPQLIPMINEGYTLSRTSQRIKDQYWYKVLKPQMLKLVGFNSEDPELCSTEVYDKVYQFFIKVMEM